MIVNREHIRIKLACSQLRSIEKSIVLETSFCLVEFASYIKDGMSVTTALAF